MHRFECPHCKKHLSYQLNQFGMRIKCPKCHQSITVGMSAAAEVAPVGGVGAFLMPARLWTLAALVIVPAVLVFVWRRFL